MDFATVKDREQVQAAKKAVDKAGRWVANATKISDELRVKGMYHGDADKIVEKYVGELYQRKAEYETAVKLTRERLKAQRAQLRAGPGGAP